MPKSLCRLLICVNHGVTNMCLNAIRENKILAKISEFTVGIPARMQSRATIGRQRNVI